MSAPQEGTLNSGDDTKDFKMLRGGAFVADLFCTDGTPTVAFQIKDPVTGTYFAAKDSNDTAISKVLSANDHAHVEILTHAGVEFRLSGTGLGTVNYRIGQSSLT